MNIILGVGDYAVTNREDGVIKTYALGSCVALVAYCPFPKVLGMAHIALPAFSGNFTQYAKRPGYFADTAVPLLLDEMILTYGCAPERIRLCLVGGARALREDDIFRIGQRNVEAVTKALAEYNLFLHKTEIGGGFGRTVEAEAASGEIRVYKYSLGDPAQKAPYLELFDPRPKDPVF